MNNESRKLSDIKNDLKIIKSNKLSASQSKFLFMGIIYEIITNKEIFPKNKDLKDFINGKLIKSFNLGDPYKDYLFKSRTTLITKIQRLIYQDLDYNTILYMVKFLDEILFSNIHVDHNIYKSKDSKNDLDEWMNFLGNNKDY